MKTKRISARTQQNQFRAPLQKSQFRYSLKRSQFRSPTQNQVDFDPHSNIKSISMPRHKNRVKFDVDTKNKSLSTTQIKTKSISMLTLKPRDLRPASNYRVNFDHPHKNQVYRSPHYKHMNFGPHSQFLAPEQKQVNCDPNTKTESNSIPHTKSSQFRRHHWNQVNSIPNKKSSKIRCPDTETEMISIKTLKPSFFRPPQKLRQFRSLH